MAPQSLPSAFAGDRRKKRASSLQVRDPHNSNDLPVVEGLLLGLLVAGPDKIFLGSEGLSFLLNPKLSLGDMTDHGVHHGRTHCLRSRLHDDIAHRDSLETGDDGWRHSIVFTNHDTWPRR